MVIGLLEGRVSFTGVGMQAQAKMKLSGVFLSTALVATLAIFGCGDDDGDGNGGSPEEVCNTGDCVDNAAQREACEAACRVTPGDCERLAQDLCL